MIIQFSLQLTLSKRQTPLISGHIFSSLTISQSKSHNKLSKKRSLDQQIFQLGDAFFAPNSENALFSSLIGCNRSISTDSMEIPFRYKFLPSFFGLIKLKLSERWTLLISGHQTLAPTVSANWKDYNTVFYKNYHIVSLKLEKNIELYDTNSFIYFS